jgi:hypothetical protein
MRVINEIELACELAHRAIIREYLVIDWSDDFNEEDLYAVSENGDCIYKDGIQDQFNDYYDKYLDIIDNCEIKQLI